MKVKFVTVLTLAFVALLAACGGKSDEDLQKAVAAKLASDNVSGVTVAVKGGAATLTGEVADITVRNKAESSAKSVEGIKSVDASGVRTRPLATPAPAPADPMLKGKVEENLKKAGCTGATVEISSGTVTLSGTVPDAKYAECVKVVNESGAGKLNNQLQKGK
jgi:osmotically-inducible protein OsmY